MTSQLWKPDLSKICTSKVLNKNHFKLHLISTIYLKNGKYIAQIFLYKSTKKWTIPAAPAYIQK